MLGSSSSGKKEPRLLEMFKVQNPATHSDLKRLLIENSDKVHTFFPSFLPKALSKGQKRYILEVNEPK